VEVVLDPVMRSLILEKTAINSAKEELRSINDQMMEQARLLRAALYSINKDTSEKEVALVIDKHCFRLNEKSPNLQNCLQQTRR
jgi:hypothetical protein